MATKYPLNILTMNTVHSKSVIRIAVTRTFAAARISRNETPLPCQIGERDFRPGADMADDFSRRQTR